jgi:NADPH:quinone reductase-like Zn-dependent oxidoreductase
VKAIVQRTYGPPEVLQLTDVDRPDVADDAVLVRVRATSVHADIWHAVAGLPYFARPAITGLRRPRHPVPGIDLAGTVEAVGSGVSRFAPGDAVFGQVAPPNKQWVNAGTFAEFAAAPEAVLARAPNNLSFEEAAGIPAPGLIALANIEQAPDLRPGDRVLVNGAGGAVGTVAIQIAKAAGAHVTGVDGPGKQEFMRSLGADEVLDYTRTDYTAAAGRYRLIVDIPMNRPFSQARRALQSDGGYLAIGHDDFGRSGNKWLGSIPAMLSLTVRAPFTQQLPGLTTSQDMGALMHTLADLAGAGQLTPVIARTYPLAEAAAALRYLMDGEPRGRVILTV